MNTKTHDPMDKHSRPLRKKRGKLANIYYMKPRRNPQKPGRELVVTYDDRYPLVKKFRLHYSYYVHFFKKGSIAGNHYHHKKEELFIPIKGAFTVFLEDIKTGHHERIRIDSKKFPIVHIKKRLAHKVLSGSKDAILLVMATSAGTISDEYKYEISF